MDLKEMKVWGLYSDSNILLSSVIWRDIDIFIKDDYNKYSPSKHIKIFEILFM